MKIRKLLVDFTKLRSVEILENCHLCPQGPTTMKWVTLRRARGSGWQILTSDICQSHMPAHSSWLKNSYFYFSSISQIFYEYLSLGQITILAGVNGKSSFQILVPIINGKLRWKGCYMWYHDYFGMKIYLESFTSSNLYPQLSFSSKCFLAYW